MEILLDKYLQDVFFLTEKQLQLFGLDRGCPKMMPHNFEQFLIPPLQVFSNKALVRRHKILAPLHSRAMKSFRDDLLLFSKTERLFLGFNYFQWSLKPTETFFN